MTHTIISNIATKQFYLQAFQEYCEDRAKSYANLISLVSEVMSIAGESEVESITLGEAWDLVNSLSDFNPLAYIPFNGGSIRIGEYIKEVYNSIGKDVGLTTGEQTDVEDAIVTLLKREGTGSETMTLTDSLSELQTNLHSVVSFAAAAASMRFDTTDARISYYRDYVGRYFNNAYLDISGSLSYGIELLEKAQSASDFFNIFTSVTGIDDEETDYTNTSIYDYTGASPMGPLDFGSIANAVTSTLKAGFDLVSNVVKGFASLASTVFNWAGSKLHEVFVDPYDLETMSNGEAPIVEGFCMESSGVSAGSTIPSSYLPFAVETANWLNSRDWVKIDTIFGILLFKMTNVTWNDRTIPDNVVEFNYNYDVKWYPKPLSPKLLSPIDNAADRALFEGIHDVSEIAELSRSLSTGSSIYADTSGSEIDMFRGFMNSTALMTYFSEWAYREASGVTTGTVTVGFHPIESNVPSVITNLDFIKAVSGWNGTDFGNRNVYAVNNQQRMFLNIRGLISAFILMAADRLSNPIDYAFLPYSTTNIGVPSALYRVKTDKENYDAFNKFVTTTIVIVAVAVVAIVATVAISRFMTKFSMKTVGMQRSIENKLAAGEDVTPKQMKALKKRKTIQKLMGYSTGAMIGGSALDNVNLSDNAEVVSLISG